MKKIFRLLTLTLGLFLSANSQAQREQPEVKFCGHNHAVERMRETDPVRYQQYIQTVESTPTTTNASTEKSGVIYTIPVVFHVLHDGGSSNISDAQIERALAILNRDYRKQNADVNDVVSQFLPLAADVEIEFVFATIAPNGACFNGITRTQNATQSNNGNDGQAQVNAIVAGNNVAQQVWPHNKYLNIYVCKNLGGAAGYTYLPNGNSAANTTNMYYNGIFMLHDYVGDIGTSSAYKSRALTHEVGHWLNLKHTWGDGNTPGQATNCNGDDGVTDTPNTVGVTSCNLNENSCGVLANVENYMDYSYCSKMFTAGQVTRMRNAITASTAGRNNIWTTANLQAVGGAPSASLCPATFTATQVALCSGNSTTFSVSNTTASITGYSWTFNGGTPASSTSANPTVTYNTAGTYPVTVTITTAGGNRTITKTSYITVTAAPSTVPYPYAQNFSAQTSLPSNITVVSGLSNGSWSYNSNGNGNNGSIYLNNFYNSNIGEIDQFTLPAVNMSSATNPYMYFDISKSMYSGQIDKLEVEVAVGCGGTYQTVYSKSDPQLNTTTTTSNYTTPTSWRRDSVSIAAGAGQSLVQVRFKATNGYGNNIFIDNINIKDAPSTGSGSSNPVVGFSSNTNSVCVGQTITYTSNNSNANNYAWNFGANATPATVTGPGPHTVTYSAAGSKTVTLTMTHNGQTTSATNNVTVNALPSVTLPALNTVCNYHSAFALNQGSPAGGSYSGNGVSGTTFNPANAGNGTHQITYTYTNGAGCTNSASSSITVSGCLGIDDEEASAFKVYPNPANDYLIIEADRLQKVEIYNLLGKVVLTFNAEQSSYDVSSLINGAYFVKVVTENGTKTVKVEIK